MKIGVFDSGVGALLVAKEIKKKIHEVKIIIKTDPEYFPYGDKSPEFIQARVVHFAKEFQKEGCQIVVISCNSATTNGIGALRYQFPNIQFVGIEPPVNPIVELTRTGKVAIMGTEATIKSRRLRELVGKFSKGVSIELIACPGLAGVIEHSSRPTPESETLLKKFLDRPIKGGVDAVGLACTHYPYLTSQMKELYPHVTFYDPTQAVVSWVGRLIGKTKDTLLR